MRIQAVSGKAAHHARACCEGTLGFRRAAIFRRRRREVADRRVAGNRQQIAFVQTLQIAAKMAYAPQFVVSGDPLVRQHRAVFEEHFQHQGMSGLKTHLLRHARLAESFPILRPFLRQIQTKIDQGVFFRRNISPIDADLAVIDFALSAAPLAGHAHRGFPLLAKRRGIEHQHAVGRSQFAATPASPTPSPAVDDPTGPSR